MIESGIFLRWLVSRGGGGGGLHVSKERGGGGADKPFHTDILDAKVNARTNLSHNNKIKT